MKLELEDGTVFEQPSERDIEQALETLMRQENNFAILSQNEMTYIQVAGSSDAGYQMEYQAGNTEHHYRVPEPVPYNDVVAAFKNYANGNRAWRAGHPWERETNGLADRPGCAGVFLALLVLVIGATTLSGAVTLQYMRMRCGSRCRSARKQHASSSRRCRDW